MLPIHFGDDKKKQTPKLNLPHGEYSLKQHNTTEYLGYFDSNLNGESMARKVLKKINTRLNLVSK